MHGALIFAFSQEAKGLKVSFYEREGIEKTLRPYEIQNVDWEQLEQTCFEVSRLLVRSNRLANSSPENLERLKRSGQVLFDLLIPAKAKEKLANTTAQSLILDLDDSLVHLPWELLYDGRDFLCRRFAMGRQTSTRQTPTARSTRSLKAPFKVLILADPRGDLEASYREGLEIKTFLDQRRDVFAVDLKSHPVEIAFVKKNLRDYDIVHYAGHAVYRREKPSESGWILNDSTLTAGEIAAMGGLRPMPALVFANGCQSSQTEDWNVDEGHGQQIFGLANAFLLAGVQHYIGAFWEIVDEPSSCFAKRFYSALAERKSLGAAIREARSGVVEAYGEERLAWASYMLYGDPTAEFVSGDNILRVQNATQRPKQSVWKYELRGCPPVTPTGPKPRHSPLFLPLMGAFLLASAYVTYSRINPGTARTCANTPPIFRYSRKDFFVGRRTR